MKTKSPDPQGLLNGIDYERLNTLRPTQRCVKALNLPALRQRKLNGILNALTMQIEDGGDFPEVNDLLIKALRVAVIAQVGEKSAAATLKALEQFEQSEAARMRSRKAS